ncbi:MAG: hypothetical protein J6I52_10010 [Prevotella sp.]|nr:hypothetical protein [Prevotella sp.]
MSNFIQVPNEIITKLTSRSKHEEAFVYAAIRSQIKDCTRTASYSMADLADLCNVKEKNIFNYIERLESVGLFSLLKDKKKQSSGDHRYNVYQFPYIKDNCIIIDPAFVNKDQSELTAEQRGIMLFIKANCIDGTNHFQFKSKEELANMIGVGKNRITSVIDGLEAMGSIRIINHTIIITDSNFPLYLNGTPTNYIYHLIYNYCLYKEVEPPIKHKMCLTYLNMKYNNRYKELKEDLLDKCKNLPNDVSLHYFCKALLNKMPEKKPQPLYFTM